MSKLLLYLSLGAIEGIVDGEVNIVNGYILTYISKPPPTQKKVQVY